MRHGFVLGLLCVAVTTPAAHAQDAKPFAHLELEGKFKWVTYMAFAPDGKMFAASHCWSHGPCYVTLWDTEEGNQLRKINGPEAVMSYNALAFSPNGKWLAVGGINEILLVDPHKGKRVHQMKDHHGEVLQFAFHPNNDLLASCGRGEDVILWETATGKKKATLPFERDIIYSVAFAADGKTLTALGFNRVEGGYANWTVRVWDATTFKLVRTLAWSEIDPIGVAYLSADGGVLAIRRQGALELWDTVTGRQTGSIKSRGEGWLMHVSLTGDGKKVVTFNVREKAKGVIEGQLELWDIRTGKRLLTKEIPSERIEQDYGPYCLFSAAGDTVAFQVGDSTLALWRTKALLQGAK
jgi:WD40 repeat protein